ncbi:MAG: transketolase [Clostridiales bacterium]|nr:transketolase [Clostridiales bacterium]
MIEFTSREIRTWSRLGSCGSYGIAAVDLAEKDDRVVMLTADLCYYSGLERFKRIFPDRLYNLGIAEENMIGVAAGMAKEGYVPFASTYGTFASMRCADQVRVNMGYMQLPIKLVGLTSGLSVGILGATHIANEDLAVMRSIPGIDILSPADCAETIKAVEAAAKTDRPTYIRLTGTMNNPPVYKEDFSYKIGQANIVREGSDISIIATGTMVYTSMRAAQNIENEGISVEVIDMHTIKPLDYEAVRLASEKKMIVTCEEHSRIGGLGSAVNDILMGSGYDKPCLNIGIADRYPHAADYKYLMESYGLDEKSVTSKILDKWRNYYD